MSTTQADTQPRWDDPLIGLEIDRRYVISGVLGRGGMGVVYEGVHTELGRPLAIKVLNPAWASDPEAVERFLREARTASSLSHANIVDVTDLGRLADGRPYLVMPKIVGMDIATVLTESGPLPPRRVAELLSGVASALDLIHSKGYVHRDIKPENLMYVVREDGSETVMLLDFGIAALMLSNKPRLTAQGTIFGTPEYLAPEVCGGKLPDGRGDVYALATVAFELITGQLPFKAETPLQLLPMKVQIAAASLSSVSGTPFSPELEAVMARGLARLPDQRYATASELTDAFRLATERSPMSWRPGLLRSTSNSGTHFIGKDGEALPAGQPQSTQQLQPAAAALHPFGEAAVPTARLRASSPLRQTSLESSVSENDSSVEYEVALRSPSSPWLVYGAMIAGAALLLAAGLWLLPSRPSIRPTQDALTERRARTPAPSPPAPSAPAPAIPVPSASAVVAEAPKRNLDPENLSPQPEPIRRTPRSQNRSEAVTSGSRSPESRAFQPPAPVEDEVAPTPSPPLSALPLPSSISVRPIPEAVSTGTQDQAAADDRDPELAERLAREGTSALLRGEVGQAVDVLRRATAADPGNAAAWRGLGLALERSGRRGEAIDAYRHYLRLEPTGEHAGMVRERMQALE
jgi:serine/threonine protein kinase